jgi:hypothetical protein
MCRVIHSASTAHAHARTYTVPNLIATQDITGIYKHNFDAALNRKQGFPVFSTVIIANYINKREDSLASFRISEEDEQQILQLAKDPRIGQRVYRQCAYWLEQQTDCLTRSLSLSVSHSLSCALTLAVSLACLIALVDQLYRSIHLWTQGYQNRSRPITV